jgi:hypothetical protein
MSAVLLSETETDAESGINLVVMAARTLARVEAVMKRPTLQTPLSPRYLARKQHSWYLGVRKARRVATSHRSVEKNRTRTGRRRGGRQRSGRRAERVLGSRPACWSARTGRIREKVSTAALDPFRNGRLHAVDHCGCDGDILASCGRALHQGEGERRSGPARDKRSIVCALPLAESVRVQDIRW